MKKEIVHQMLKIKQWVHANDSPGIGLSQIYQGAIYLRIGWEWSFVKRLETERLVRGVGLPGNILWY